MKVTIPDRYFPVFESIGQLLTVPEGSVIYLENEEANSLYIVTKGRVRAYLSSEKGKELTLEVLKKGRLFGDNSFLSHSYHPVNIVAVTETEIILCPTSLVIPLLSENPDLMLLVFQHLTQTCDELTHQLTRLTTYNAEQKIADFLLCETQKGMHSIPYTHENIAECLNMNRVTVSRIMNQLAKQNILQSSYGTVTIQKPDVLQKIIESK